MKQDRKDIDDLIKDHLKMNLEQIELSDDFNSRLMNKMKEGEVQTSINSFPTYNAPAWPLILSVLACLIVLAMAFFLSAVNFEVLSSWSLSFDLSFLHSKGLKYSIFALSAILFFTFFDQYLQIRSKKYSN